MMQSTPPRNMQALLQVLLLRLLQASGVAGIGLVLAGLAVCGTAHGQEAAREADPGTTYAAIDLSLFGDGIQHWQGNQGRAGSYDRYAPDQIVAIADNLLRYQNDDGGWPKNIDWLARLDPAAVRAQLSAQSLRSTLDNRNTYSHVAYLARVHAVTGLDRFRAAAERGLDYILREQRPSGGWRGADVDAITFNDDVMTGVMGLLLDIVQDEAPHFDWLDAGRRAQARAALERAVDVTLAAQVVVRGVRTAWGQQHDHETLAPVRARSYELPALTPGESSGVVRLLMRLDDPSPAVVEAVEAAVAWMRAVAIEGLRLEEVPIEAAAFEWHTAETDRIVVEDASAPPLWARYYEIETNRPFFCNRDGRKVYTLAEVALERRTGYAWYGTWPASLLADAYPAWRARIRDDR